MCCLLTVFFSNFLMAFVRLSLNCIVIVRLLHGLLLSPLSISLNTDSPVTELVVRIAPAVTNCQRVGLRCKCWMAMKCIQPFNVHIKTAEQRTVYSNALIVHWPLMGGLLHLVQQGGTWEHCGPAQSPPRCTKCNSSPMNGRCTNFILRVFDKAL